MASMTAKQNALLRAYASFNTSVESFETPSSAAWAYNFVLGYTRPGSCAVELPLPILPTLDINDKATVYARPGTQLTFNWDAAGRVAAARSGRPLFVAWVNQLNLPVFTLVTALGDGSGTANIPLGLSGAVFAVLTAQPELTSIEELTAATLAGPVILRLTT